MALRWDTLVVTLFLLLDGVGVIQLSNSSGPNTQSGTQDFTVAAGQTFGFRINCTDCGFGPATVTISNFSAPSGVVTTSAPIPTLQEWALLLMGLLLGGLVWRRSRRGMSA